MIRSKRVPDSNIMELTIDGAINQDGYDEALALFYQLVEEYEYVHILKEFGLMKPWLYVNVRQGVKMFSLIHHIGKIAVVADQKWISWISVVVGVILRINVRTFKGVEIEKARTWLHEDALFLSS